MSILESLRLSRRSRWRLSLVIMTGSLLHFLLIGASVYHLQAANPQNTTTSDQDKEAALPVITQNTTLSEAALNVDPPNTTASHEAREAALPVYLRGIGWPKVEDLLEQDLRIGNDVVPIHYSINLTVDVRGYNSSISTFQGTVSIDLNITKSMRGIEIHQVGLDIRETVLILPEENDRLRSFGGRINSLRETIILFPDTDFKPTTARLEINYSGRSYRNRYGLFETWSRMEGESPRIALVTMTSPTGSRFWFPSFDEPNMKATFQLSVDHPSSLNAYSNTRYLSRMEDGNRTQTIFGRTPLLPTYLVALALNDLPSKSISYRHHEVRVFGQSAELALNHSRQALEMLWNDPRFAGVPFISDKTDMLIIEDLDLALELPGMIIVGAGLIENIPDIILHEFLHQYFGNLITQTTFDDAWIAEGFATMTSPSKIYAEPNWLAFASKHEAPVRKVRRFADSVSSTIHFADPLISYYKSAQILDIGHETNRDGFWPNTKDMLLRHAYGNIDGSEFISEITQGLNETSAERLRQLLTQPGRVLIVVKRSNGTMEIEKMRYHSSFFDSELRDTTTPFAMPLFYRIDGIQNMQWLDATKNHFTIAVSDNASISFDSNYWCLMEVIYEMRAATVVEARRSILAAAEIGYFTFDKLVDNIRLNAHLFSKEEFDQLLRDLWTIIVPRQADKRELGVNCATRNFTVLFSEYERESLEQTILYNILMNHHLIENLICGFTNASYNRFLHNTFLDNSPILRGRDLIWMLATADQSQFPGVFTDFFSNVYAKTPNPFMSFNILQIFTIMFVQKDITDREAEQLRSFVRSHPTLAASLSEKVVVALEKHYVLKQRTDFYNVTQQEFQAAFDQFGSILKD